MAGDGRLGRRTVRHDRRAAGAEGAGLRGGVHGGLDARRDGARGGTGTDRLGFAGGVARCLATALRSVRGRLLNSYSTANQLTWRDELHSTATVSISHAPATSATKAMRWVC